MDKQKLDRANQLSSLIGDYNGVIDRYCNGMSVNEMSKPTTLSLATGRG